MNNHILYCTLKSHKTKRVTNVKNKDRISTDTKKSNNLQINSKWSFINKKIEYCGEKPNTLLLKMKDGYKENYTEKRIFYDDI